MKSLWNLLGGLLGTVVLVLPFNLFQSWVAAHIWLMLVVPLTGWRPLSWAILFGIAATLRVIHSRHVEVKRDDHKTDLEHEHPWAYAFICALTSGFFAPICIWVGAWIVSRMVL
jgi:hypothetical protein